MAFTYPPIFINAYLKEKIGNLINLDVPFFPTSPSTIEQLTQTATINNTANLFAVYDRMFKMRRKAFPHIKDEQLLYYFYSLSIPEMMEATQIIADLMDRGDESAQDLNAWLQAKQASQNPIVDDNGVAFPAIFFHEIKVYQLEETRDIVDFGTARTFAGNKIIIDYCYHSKGYSDSGSSYNGTAL